MKNWMVYFINSEGYREGNEYILAVTREDAIAEYRVFFNISNCDRCIAIPVYDKSW